MPSSFRPLRDVFLFACLASPASLRVRGSRVLGVLREKHVSVRVFAGLGACWSKRVVPACWGGSPPYTLGDRGRGSWFPLPYFLLFGIIGKNSSWYFTGLEGRPGEKAGALKSWGFVFPFVFRRCSVVSPLKHLRGVVLDEDRDAPVMRYDRNVSVRT